MCNDIAACCSTTQLSCAVTLCSSAQLSLRCNDTVQHNTAAKYIDILMPRAASYMPCIQYFIQVRLNTFAWSQCHLLEVARAVADKDGGLNGGESRLKQTKVEHGAAKVCKIYNIAAPREAKIRSEIVLLLHKY